MRICIVQKKRTKSFLHSVQLNEKSQGGNRYENVPSTHNDFVHSRRRNVIIGAVVTGASEPATYPGPVGILSFRRRNLFNGIHGFVTEFTGNLFTRNHEISTGNRLTTANRSPLTLETKGANVPRDGIARQCGPVGDSQDDEERSDDLFATTIRLGHLKILWNYAVKPEFLRGSARIHSQPDSPNPTVQ